MGWRYDVRRDMMTGHDYPGVCGNGMARFQLDELELGARAALEIDDPEGDQWWWVLIGNPALKAEQEADGSRRTGREEE